jgi:2,3-bisphosphoglycerate-dependent phosphoglycerate mutase
MPESVMIPEIIDEAIADATSWGAKRLEVVLIRHGEPLPESERRAYEALDPPLSGLGRRQAEAASHALAGDGIEAVYSSDLARAADTAEIVGDRLDAPVLTMSDLREITIYRESADEADDPPAWRDAAAAFVADGRWEAFLQPGLDPAFRLRVRRAIGQIAATRTTGTVAVVCHSGVINAQLADTLAMDRDYFVRPAHGSISRVRLSVGRWNLESVNETAHLRPDLLTA